MADELTAGGPIEDVVMEKIDDKIINCRDLALSSDSETDKPDSPVSVKSKIYRLFGRERPLHKVFGAGKPADTLLWREKKVSAGLLGAATVLWLLFELVQYHFLTFVCHSLILSLASSFLWSKLRNFSNKSTESIPEIHLPERPFLQIASCIRVELNCAFAALRDIALGRDLKKFLMVITGLWIVSKVANWFSFLTLIYICFVLLLTVPKLYEKYEDEIDPYAEKLMMEIQKQYEVLDAKVLNKIPIGRFKAKTT